MDEVGQGEFVVPYTDPRLRSRDSLLRLVHALRQHKLITCRRVERAKVGIFTANKKDESIRLMFDCRVASLLCRPPLT